MAAETWWGIRGVKDMGFEFGFVGFYRISSEAFCNSL